MSQFDGQQPDGQPPQPATAQPEAGGGNPADQQQGTEQQQGQDAQSLLTGGDQSEAEQDAVYEREFERIFGSGATGGGEQTSQVGQQPGQQAGQPQPGESQPGSQQGQQQGQQGGQGDGSGQDAATRMGLSQERQHLLSRNHLTPEAVESLPADQREAFLSNLEKREADTQAEIKRLRQAAGEAGGQGEQQGGEQGEGQQSTDSQQGQDGQLTQSIREAADSMVETFGDEAKPFAEQTVKLAQTVEQSQQQLSQMSEHNQLLQQTVADMTLRSAVDRLTDEYPSLKKQGARDQVLQKFRQAWPNSPRKSEQGPIIDRIQAAMRDTVASEFGNVTESAAQQQQQQRTEQQLQQQPNPGQGGNRPAAVTEDDIYDQAFSETLAKELSAA